MTDILRQGLRRQRVATAAVAVGMSLFIVLAMALAQSLQGPLERMAQQFPEALLKLVGANVPGGYVMAESFNLDIPIALVVYAVLAGASSVAGDERDGTMQLLSSYPVTRMRIAGAQIAAVIMSLAITVIVFAGVASISARVIDIGISVHGVVAQSVHLFMLALCFCMVAAGIGAATGRTDVAAGATGAVVASSYLAFAVLPISGHDGWVRVSPWHYYAGSNPLANGFDGIHLVVLGSIACIAAMIGVWTFTRRDLKG